ncbi:RHS repeat-associated core domain-containing protein [Lysobacter enzymogenes]|uniref:RHS repeat-associated core domain-containing protein n=1 Tax=Lysobacter enzymogenes TaxID=69 RepID=UPI00384BA3AE
MSTRMRDTRYRAGPPGPARIQSWLRPFALLGLLIGAAGASAQESEIAWKAASFTGQEQGPYKTQLEAEEAIKTLPSPFPGPSPFPYINQIRGQGPRGDGTSAVVYWMGLLQPLDPDWSYRHVTNTTAFTTEPQMVASLKAQYDQDYPYCPIKAVLTPAGDWAASQPANAGRIEQRTFNVEYYDGRNTAELPCVKKTAPSTATRSRRQQCPHPFVQWSNERQACVNEAFTASLITNKILECGGERDNPCNVKTGEKIEHHTDIDLSWIALTRSYHSGIAVRSGGFGPGWTHSLDLRLNISPDTLGLSGGNGYQVRYKKVGDAFIAADNSGDRVAASGTQWKLYRGGDVLVFDNKGRLIEQQYEDGTSLIYTYGDYDRLDKVTHSTGRSLQFNYASNASDALIASVSADGATLASYTYTTGRQVETATYPGGSQRTYHYEDTRFPRHLTGVTHEDNQRYSTFAYDAKGRVISSQHAGGAGGITLTYPAEGGSEVTDSLGQKTRYGLTSGSGALPRRFGDIVDETGTVKNLYNDEASDFRGRPASLTNRKGVKAEYAYAEANDAITGAPARTVTTTEAVGLPEQRVSTATIDIASNRPIRTAVGEQETRIVRNARLQPVSVAVRDTVTNEVRTTTYAYCEAADVAAANSACPILGLLKSVDGPRTDVNDVTAFEYYGSDDSTCATTPALCTYRKGDLRKTIDALGRATEVLGYDPQGRPLSVLDANGVVTDYEYQSRGWLTATKVRGADNAVETDDRITRIEHWPTGLVKKVTLPGNVATSYTYDAAQRLSDITDNAGNTIHYTLDLAGNRKQEETKTAGGVLKQTLSRVFNVLSQLETLKDASQNATGFTYDPNGNPYQTTDALGRQTVLTHDPLNRLSRTLAQVSITAPGSDTGVLTAVETKMEYNALDQVLKVTDPNSLATTYAYNGFGDRTKLTSPDTGVTDYTYNAGLLATKKDANDTDAHRYTYDALGRPKAIFYTAAGPADVEYDYDTVNTECTTGQTFALGRLTSQRAEGTELKYCYDRFGQVVRKVQIVAGKSFTLKYAYTIGGHLYTVTYPDGTTVDYVRDTQARIKEIGVRPYGGTRTVLLNNAAYEPFGPVTGWTYGNGRALSRTYDLDYRPKTIFDPAAGGLSLGYGYNTVGELTELKDGLLSASLASYAYDELGRLTKTQDGATALETYKYDPTGNRTSLKDGGGEKVYDYVSGSHRLGAVGAVARGYDAVGNTVSIGGSAREFVYNANDRLSQFKQGGVVKASYRYNAIGERVATTGATTGTIDSYTLYDEGGNWIGDYDGTGAAKQQAVWFGSAPVGLVVGSGSAQSLQYVQPDQLGTPRAVIDPSRNVAVWTWNAKNEAFGNSPPNQDPDLDGTAFVFNMRLPGQRLDTASGLFYNYFRDYDPISGRYVQSDPIGMKGGINTFQYSNGNPLLYTDFYGLKPGDCYMSPNIAAANAICEINPQSIKEDFEYQGWIYRTKNNYYSYTTPHTDRAAHYNIPSPRPAGALGRYHTHGDDGDPLYDDENFSPKDKDIPYGDSEWLGTPTGRILQYSTTNVQAQKQLRPPSPNNGDAVNCETPKNILYRAIDWLLNP